MGDAGDSGPPPHTDADPPPPLRLIRGSDAEPVLPLDDDTDPPFQAWHDRLLMQTCM